MTLHEAVLRAKRKDYKWLAIDKSLDIYGFTHRPGRGGTIWCTRKYSHLYTPIGKCTTPLSGNFTDWLIDVEKLTL